jgi:hypothetical protein
VSGLFDAAQLPLALMVSADQVPFCFADIAFAVNCGRGSSDLYD